LAVAECVPAAGPGAEECDAVAVPQPAASTASSANPAAGRARVNDMACPSTLRTFATSEPGRPGLPAVRQAAPKAKGVSPGAMGGALGGRADELGADGGARPMEGSHDERQADGGKSAAGPA